MATTKYPQYQALRQKVSNRDRIEGITKEDMENGEYEIGNFSEDAKRVKSELGLHDETQAKLYICAKLDLEPEVAIERVDIIGPQNMQIIPQEIMDQLF